MLSVMKFNVSVMNMQFHVRNHDVRCVLEQFCGQAEVLRGIFICFYIVMCDSVQYGAQRLHCTDGSSVLSTHSLFVVQEFAVDKVRLVGVHPSTVKGRYVDMPLDQWEVMFKIVSGEAAEHEHRILRADAHFKETADLVTTTHPAYMIVPALHREETSVRMNKKTDTVFDVRGQPILQGDFVRGCLWPNDVPAGMHSVKLSDLQQFTGMLRTGSGDSQSPVGSVSLEAYRSLVEKGDLQLTSHLDKQCMRVMGFLRIEPDKDSDEPMAMKDPLFAVMHVLTTAVNPVINQLKGASQMLLVPRHHSGQWYFVKSGRCITVMLSQFQQSFSLQTYSVFPVPAHR